MLTSLWVPMVPGGARLCPVLESKVQCWGGTLPFPTHIGVHCVLRWGAGLCPVLESEDQCWGGPSWPTLVSSLCVLRWRGLGCEWACCLTFLPGAAPQGQFSQPAGKPMHSCPGTDLVTWPNCLLGKLAQGLGTVVDRFRTCPQSLDVPLFLFSCSGCLQNHNCNVLLSLPVPSRGRGHVFRQLVPWEGGASGLSPPG